MASWDTPAVAAPPTSAYGAPLVDFNKLADLPKDYYAGKEMQRQDEKANLFRNGIPKDAAGNIDVGTITDKLARINPDYAMPLINLQMQGQQGQIAANAIMGGQGGQPGAPGQPSSALLPQARQPNAGPSQPTGAPAPAAQPTGDGGQDTIRSLATEFSGGNDAMPAIGSAARVLRINPDAPLTPDQAAKVKSFFGNAAKPPTVTADASGQPAQPSAPQSPAAPPAPPAQAQPQAAASPGWSQADADSLSLRATRLNAYAAAVANVNPHAADAAKAEAVATEARAKQIREYISGEDTSTTEQKNANDPSVAQYELTKEQNKNDVDRFGKQYDTITKVGEQADETLPQLDLAKRLVNDPNFVSGSLASGSDMLKRLAVAFNLNPNTATPDQLFDKVRAGSILNQIKGMAGTGPVRVAEMKFIDQMIAGRENTPETLRTLLEIESRLYQRAQGVRDMAHGYNNGHLDNGFEKKVTEYKNSPKNALFSPAELKDPRLIAPPVFQTPQQVAAAKLPHGSPFKTADGRIKYIP